VAALRFIEITRRSTLGIQENSYIATRAKPLFTLSAIGSFVETAMVLKGLSFTLYTTANQLQARNSIQMANVAISF